MVVKVRGANAPASRIKELSVWYDIRYLAPALARFRGVSNVDCYVFKYQKIPARSAAEALDTFGTRKMLEINREQETWDIANKPVAIPLKYEWDTRDKEYWSGKWGMALALMPAKTKRSFTTLWVTLPPGETPMPRFIEERAKGKMRMGGRFVEQQVSYMSHKYEYGRIAALAIILGYITTDDKDTKRPRANCCALQGRKIPESSRPRDPKVRRLLAELGTMDKAEIVKLLARKREAMKHAKPR